MSTTQLLIGYLRVSTDAQAASGLGIDAQRAAIAAYAQQRALEVEWVEDAASGKDTRRPGLQCALTLLRTGKATALVVAKLDRLSRSLKDFAEVLETSRRERWTVVALDLGVDTSTPGGELLANVVATVAQYERRLIGERTSAALQRKKARGARLGRPQVIPASTLAMVKDLRAQGRTYESIASTLNARGVPTARYADRGWTVTKVRRALQTLRLNEDAAWAASRNA